MITIQNWKLFIVFSVNTLHRHSTTLIIVIVLTLAEVFKGLRLLTKQSYDFLMTKSIGINTQYTVFKIQHPFVYRYLQSRYKYLVGNAWQIRAFFLEMFSLGIIYVSARCRSETETDTATQPLALGLKTYKTFRFLYLATSRLCLAMKTTHGTKVLTQS